MLFQVSLWPYGRKLQKKWILLVIRRQPHAKQRDSSVLINSAGESAARRIRREEKKEPQGKLHPAWLLWEGKAVSISDYSPVSCFSPYIYKIAPRSFYVLGLMELFRWAKTQDRHIYLHSSLRLWICYEPYRLHFHYVHKLFQVSGNAPLSWVEPHDSTSWNENFKQRRQIFQVPPHLLGPSNEKQ